MRAAIALSLALLAPASSLGAQPAPEDWTIERTEWRDPELAATSVEVINLHGDVRVRAGDPVGVRLIALVQHHRDDPRAAEVAAEPTERGVRIEMRYPADPAGGAAAEWERRRVDVTVLVPPAAAVRVETATGLAEVKGLGSGVEARSRAGDIVVRAAGPIVARSDHGAIFAQPRRTDWPRPSRLETVTGEIRVELPRDGAAAVRLETRGEITTDYTIEIEPPGDGQLKRGTARIGAGGGALFLASDRGAIKLLRSPVPAAG